MLIKHIINKMLRKIIGYLTFLNLSFKGFKVDLWDCTPSHRRTVISAGRQTARRVWVNNSVRCWWSDNKCLVFSACVILCLTCSCTRGALSLAHFILHCGAALFVQTYQTSDNLWFCNNQTVMSQKQRLISWLVTRTLMSTVLIIIINHLIKQKSQIE